MRLCYRLRVIAPLVAAVAAVPVTYSMAAPSRAESGPPPVNPLLGKELYRALCSRCHALAEASPAGLGSSIGPGEFGGLSFSNLRVSYDFVIVAVTDGQSPHQLAVERMTWAELEEVAAWLAAATKNNPLAVPSEDR